jgi:hypothetical protein
MAGLCPNVHVQLAKGIPKEDDQQAPGYLPLRHWELHVSNLDALSVVPLPKELV